MSWTIVIRHGGESPYPIRVRSLSGPIGVIGSGLIELNLKWVRLCTRPYQVPAKKASRTFFETRVRRPAFVLFFGRKNGKQSSLNKKTTNNALDSLSALATLIRGPTITCSGIHHVFQTHSTLQSRMLPWRLWSVVTYNNALRPGPPEDRTHVGQIFIIN